MADIFDASDLTLNREDIKKISEAIFTAFYQKPAISEFHTLVPGVIHNKQIAILGIFEGLAGIAKTDCGQTPNPNQVGASEKTWTPKYIGDRFEQCFAPLLDTFFKWGLNSGYKKPELTGTEFALFIEERISDAIVESVYRHAWFGDTAAAHYNDSPAGIITNGTTLAYFNVIDGLWKQIFAEVAANSERLTTGLASKNGQATYLLQKFNDTDTTNQVVTKTLDTIVTDSDERLSAGKRTPFYIVTKSVADQYKRERKYSFPAIDMAYERIEEGIQRLRCDGFDLYVFSFWDRMIKEYENNGTKYHLPHRILYTTKENIQIGTQEEKDLSDFDAFDDKYHEKFVIKFAYNLDAKLIEDDQFQVAY